LVAEYSAGADAIGNNQRGARRARRGRICSETGCSTVLSMYNDLDFCALHQPMVVPRMRGVVLGD